MLDDFWLDGICASENGIILQREIEFDAPEPVVESLSVPGRNGDIIYSTGRFSNVKGKATCYLLDPNNVSQSVAAMNAWVMRCDMYRRLETLNEPEIFRLARLVRGANLDARLNRINAFVLELDCQPQKFLKSGEKTFTFSASGKLFNPTLCAALPIITVHGSGSGTVTVNGKTMTLTDCDVTLDSLKHYAYKGTTNKNNKVSGDWALLDERENTIAFTGGVTSVDIIPRWWTL